MCLCVDHLLKVSYKLLVGILPYLQHRCSWGQRSILKSNVKGQCHNETTRLGDVFSYLSLEYKDVF